MTDSTPSEADHVRIAKMLKTAEDVVSRLESEASDPNSDPSLLRARVNNVAQSVRLLSKQIVILADDNDALTCEWSQIVPIYLQRHL